jgi:ferritin
MISEKLEAAINEQISKEWWSAGIYKGIQAYFDAEGLPGFANWFKVQALEELTHSERLFHYLTEVGGRPRVLAIEEPRFDYDSPSDAVDYSLQHEKLVTSLINNLMNIAKEENDHAAQIMLQWFISEQVEEEATFGQLLADVKMVEGDGRGTLLLDRELKGRVFVMPAAL